MEGSWEVGGFFVGGWWKVGGRFVGGSWKARGRLVEVWANGVLFIHSLTPGHASGSAHVEGDSSSVRGAHTLTPSNGDAVQLAARLCLFPKIAITVVYKVYNYNYTYRQHRFL